MHPFNLSGQLGGGGGAALLSGILEEGFPRLQHCIIFCNRNTVNSPVFQISFKRQCFNKEF